MVPVYVPVRVEPDTVPCPDTLAEQAVNRPSKPPTGMAIEKRTVEPVTSPDNEPRPVTPLLASTMDAEPVTADPDCVICHVMRPGPDESLAVPLHVPVTVTGVADGADGADGVADGWAEDEPPPQPATAASASPNAKRPSARPEGVRCIFEGRGKLGRILARRVRYTGRTGCHETV